MSADFQYDVFLSHSSKDKPVVREIAARLREAGLRLWFDEWVLKPGDSIPAKIEEGLEHSRVLVLCMSAQAFGSDWAQLEAGTFRFRDPLNQERRFIPLRLDDAPIKGPLAQFLYINWRPAEREQEYAKLLASCRGEIELFGTNKPAEIREQKSEPSTAPKLVHIEHSGSGDIVLGNKTVGRPQVKFTPGPQHIPPETARKLFELVKEIVERLTVSGGNVQKAFQRVWGDFNAHFGLTTYKELRREKADDGIAYLRQWRASKNSRLRNADPEKFRTTQLKGIWPRSKSLGFADADLYAFASKKLKLPRTITSLNELGNQQLARLNRFLIYEERKTKKRRTTGVPDEATSEKVNDQGPDTLLNNSSRNAEVCDTGDPSLRWSSSAQFFSSRFATAFPGIRDEVVWFTDPKQIGMRLARLLREPLKVGYNSPIWWWRGPESNSVEGFRQLDDMTWLLNVDEIQIGRIAAVECRAYWQTFVYVEVNGVAPTGAYNRSQESYQHQIERRGFCAEELCLFRGRYFKRTFFEDGVTEIDGQLVDMGDEAQLRRRFVSKYNFVLSGHDSAINNSRFEMQSQSLLNELLIDSVKFEKMVEEVEKLPKRDSLFSHQSPYAD